MQQFKTSFLIPVLAVSLLSLGVTACSSPENDAKTEENGVANVDAATDTDNVEANESKSIDNNSVETANTDEVETNESRSIESGTTEVDTTDNAQVTDGTEHEEHISSN